MHARLLTYLIFLSVGLMAQKEYHLDDLERNTARVEILDISNSNLTELPDKLKACKKLTQLICRNNSITFLPNWLSDLKSLKKVDFSNNKRLNIQQTFAELSECTNLESIAFNHCNMIYLPVSVRKLKDLKHVAISNNRIKRLPPIFEYVHWEQLDLSYNCIDTLPRSIVFTNTLKELDLSFNPGITQKINYYYLSFLNNLTMLALDGAIEIPDALENLPKLEQLSIRNSTVSALPPSMALLKKLKSVDARNAKKLEISDLVEALKGSQQSLSVLKVGHLGLNTLPYNLYRLKNLKTLLIQGACLDKLSSSFGRIKVENVIVDNCSFNQPQLVFNTITQPKKIKALVVKNSYFAHGNWSISESVTLEQISINHCGLNYIPIDPKLFPNLQLLNLKGNRIPKNKIDWKTPKTLTDGEYYAIDYGANEIKKWKYNSPKPTTKRMIYTEVGDIFTLPSGTKIEVLPEAFIQTGNVTVEGDVVLEIKEFFDAADFAVSKFPTYTHAQSVSDVKYAIEVRAFCEGKEVFIKHNKPIYVYPTLKEKTALTKLYFHGYKNTWEDLKQNNNQCIVSSPFNTVTITCEEYDDLPKMAYDLKVSKVFVKIYRKLRKNEWNFLLTPEYGYREEFWDVFGDEIKGYPELKKYQGLKWKYVGDSIERDLKRLYFLSEEGKEDKLKNRYSLKGYMLDIKDILVFPNPVKDNYLLQFIEGRDTFNIEVLPQIALYEARKIQRWHRIKYKRYKRALAKRKEKWVKMDTTYLNKYERFESQLEIYRLSKMDNNYIITNNEPLSTSQHSLQVQQPGLYQMCTPLLLSKPEIKQPVFFIDGKKFHPQKVLLTHLNKGYHYWVNPKEVPKERGSYLFSIFINDELYQGRWRNNNIVLFRKVSL